MLFSVMTCHLVELPNHFIQAVDHGNNSSILAVGMPLTILVITSVREASGSTEFSRFDEWGYGRPMFSTRVRTDEECVLLSQSNWSDRTFDDMGVVLDAAVIDEAALRSGA